MKKEKEKIIDVSGRLLENDDQVFILDIPNPNLDTSHIISSLIMGKVVLAQDKDNVLVEIENNLFSCPGNKLSKIQTEESVDDIIIHVSHDIETLQLKKESEILNNMLNIEENK